MLKTKSLLILDNLKTLVLNILTNVDFYNKTDVLKSTSQSVEKALISFVTLKANY